MGKRELGGAGFENVPIVNISEKPGVTFVGKLLEKGREVEAGLGKKWIYAFELHDTNTSTVKKDEGGKYKECDVKEFDKVSVFATKLLDKKLSQAQIGDVIEIEYTGKERGKMGQTYHNFIVSVVE